ncbi:MAG: DUF3768 domain-containing protein [Rhizobiales bacterium]|nr:DUF3768 domain-containing protein [Hyphomicrobiales bacterium]
MDSHTLKRIRELNDALRTKCQGGRIQFTTEVMELDPQIRGRALSYLALYNKFSDHEDDEHDSGTFIFSGFSFVWAIGYRRPDDTGISADPSDPTKTTRVLTLHVNADILAQRVVHEKRVSSHVEVPAVRKQVVGGN